jgi:hypothetical protein
MHNFLNKYWWLGPLVAAIAYFGAFGYVVHKQDERNDMARVKAECWDNRMNPNYVCKVKRD